MTLEVQTGIGLVGMGFFLRIWSWLALKRVGLDHDGMMEIEPVKRYATDGPYRFLSHPAYLGSLLMLAGFGVFWIGWQGWVLWMPAWPFFASRIHEENVLRGNGWL